jgi:hypothetical protein
MGWEENLSFFLCFFPLAHPSCILIIVSNFNEIQVFIFHFINILDFINFVNVYNNTS